MRTIFKILIVGGLILGIVTVVAYANRQYELLDAYCYRFKKLNEARLKKNEGFISFVLAFKNNSDFDFAIHKMYFEIYINGTKISTIVLRTQKGKRNIALLKSGEYADIPLDVTFDPKKVFQASLENILDLFSDWSKINIQTKGYIAVQSSLVFLNKLPVDYTMTLKEMREPSPPNNLC